MKIGTLILMVVVAIVCGVLLKTVGDSFTGLTNVIFSIIVILCVGGVGLSLATKF